MLTPVKSTSHGIKITVGTSFQPDHSDPHHSCFVFAYKILIENKSEFTVQLLRRHWCIIDSMGEKREVEGEGVVGNQPVLTPGEKYEYVSGCNLKSEMGKMFGNYTMQRQIDGKIFYVVIPEFRLIHPAKNN